MAAKVSSATLIGIDALPVDIETQVFGSLRRFSVVGLPDNVLRESKDRVRCAIENSGYCFSHHEVIVSLAPAAVPKFGSGFDLGIALSILAAEGVLRAESLNDFVVLGELALDGKVKAAKGVFATALMMREHGGLRLLIPGGNADEAALVEGVEAYAVNSLCEAVHFLNHELELRPCSACEPLKVEPDGEESRLGDIIGQHAAKRAIEIACAGAHNLLMLGPPGSGKTMLARRIPALLPPLSENEVLQVTKVYSAMSQESLGVLHVHRARLRPFRAPHHTTSSAGLIGGGSNPLPGEISLAHCGVLFLDELTEFRRDVLEALRQPLEARHVLISRAKHRISYPADFMLVAAMNPCPCGRRGSGIGSCHCTPQAVSRYQAKISGPLLDRIDLQVWVPPVPVVEFSRKAEEDTTATVTVRVSAAREMQRVRFGGHKTNSQMSAAQLRQFCALDRASAGLVQKAQERFSLSARGYSRILRVARTIADLDRQAEIRPPHIAEALSYRLPAQT